MYRLRTLIGGAALATSLVATSCTAPPQPPVSIAVEWTATPTGPGGANDDHSFAIDSNDAWYLEARFGSAVTGDVLRIHPRVGPNGDDLGAPQFLGNASRGFLGTHTLLIPAASNMTADTDLLFFHEAGGIWSPAGTFSLPGEAHVIAYSDDTLVVRNGAGATTSVDIYDVAVSGGFVTPTLDSSFSAPAAWGSNYEAYFASAERYAFEGDVLALSSHDDNGFGPGRVAIYRNVAGTWAYEHTIVGPVPQFGRSLAIDDQGNKERLAIGVTKTPDVGQVDLYRSTLGTWTFDGTVTPPPLPADSDTAGGTEFGAEVSLDGNLLVVGTRKRLLSPTPAGDERLAYYQSVFHWNSSTWMHEQDLYELPATIDPAEGSRVHARTRVHGSHITSTLIVVPPPGGGLTQIFQSAQAWRWDRNLLP